MKTSDSKEVRCLCCLPATSPTFGTVPLLSCHFESMVTNSLAVLPTLHDVSVRCLLLPHLHTQLLLRSWDTRVQIYLRARSCCLAVPVTITTASLWAYLVC